ncbi:hypothetical protein ASPCAL13062 [Aspergillus calidoustus]|uniref:Uncharacterized protein n=1 Tax=Aspergillus calidoustus TaxID=454130 RepID=A0A0U5GGQ5_ASPCI|nr:hypothetical protein ASPCAL13062 [Aspergillus calidoustus]
MVCLRCSNPLAPPLPVGDSGSCMSSSVLSNRTGQTHAVDRTILRYRRRIRHQPPHCYWDNQTRLRSDSISVINSKLIPGSLICCRSLNQQQGTRNNAPCQTRLETGVQPVILG